MEPAAAAAETSKDSTPKVRGLKKLAAKLTGKKSKPDASAKDPAETPDTGSSENPAQGDGDADESQALAMKIRNLIDGLPIPTPGSSRTIPKPGKVPARDKTGKPILPPDASRTKDEKLISMLSSATFMNGQGSSRESVWSILDSLGPPKHDAEQDTGDPSNGNDGSSDTLDNSSIMLYAPLIPTQDSVVELGETLLVPAADSHTPQTSAFSVLQALSLQAFSWWPPKFWPFTIWNHDNDEEPAPTPPPVRVWVPSTTKLSFQVMWWGFRIYLPPPVLAILSDKQLEATKRAAMITTALTWFFSNIPVTSLPPTIQPAVLLMQKLVPYVGYIGTFISWSWSTIKSYDIGYGVYLTATWILPVALIPGTWQAYDFPTTPSDPGATPAKTPATPIPDTPAPPDTPTAPNESTQVPPPNESAPSVPVAEKKPSGGFWKYFSTS